MGNACDFNKEKQHSQVKSSISGIPQMEIKKSLDQTQEEAKINSKDLQSLSEEEKQFQIRENGTSLSKKPLSLDDFISLNLIGRGAFGKVYRVKKKDNGKIYAMKQILKKQIIDHRLESNTFLERNVLKSSKHPFIVQLKYSFQTESRLYFVMEYVAGGEFYKILGQTECLPENIVRFISAEVILALEHLNTKLKVIYRDLKPENILLSTQGHVKLTDFGLATLKKENEEKTYTLAGTPEYLAPEIITRQGHSFEVDLWTLGVFIYEMLVGTAPFSISPRNIQKIQKLILENAVSYPPSMSPEAKDLIQKLLKKNPKERLGVNGYEELKSHVFFTNIKWDDLLQMKVKSPLKAFAEVNANKQVSRKMNEKPVPESPCVFKPHVFMGITYNPDLTDPTYNSQKIPDLQQ